MLQPRSRGSVRLRSADPLDPPEIDPAFLQDDADLAVLVEGVKLSRRIAAGRSLARWLQDERAPGGGVRSDEEIAAWISANAHTIYHPVATCAMGGVVDAELRVRGVEGLRVADASVIPRLVRGHTHAATTMVGERAADLIRERR